MAVTTGRRHAHVAQCWQGNVVIVIVVAAAVQGVASGQTLTPRTLTVTTFDGGIETVGTVIFIVVIVVGRRWSS